MKNTVCAALSALILLAACQPGSKIQPYVPPTEEEEDPTPVAVTPPAVITGTADVTANSVTIRQNKYTNAPRGAMTRGIKYGTSPDNLDQQRVLPTKDNKQSGSFNVALPGLEGSTTYYYKAFIITWDAEAEEYDDEVEASEVKQFTTQEGGTAGGGDTGDEGDGNGEGSVNGLQYLGCYEIPAIDLENTESCSDSGKERKASSSGYTTTDAKWYSYYTTNANRRVVTHTFKDGAKTLRNLTVLVDKDKQGPLWVAFPMNKGSYPHLSSVSRSDNWTEDPGVPSTWQRAISGYPSGATSYKYARGHFCASNYRRCTQWADQGTFYYTNQALQWQTRFNDGIWQTMESALLGATPSGRDTLYVTVGVLYEGAPTMVSSSKGGALIYQAPSHFYTCVMKCSFSTAGTITGASGCAFIMENREYSGSSYKSYCTSIDAIEQRAGFDFFTNVPQNLQNTAEAQTTPLF